MNLVKIVSVAGIALLMGCQTPKISTPRPKPDLDRPLDAMLASSFAKTDRKPEDPDYCILTTVAKSFYQNWSSRIWMYGSGRGKLYPDGNAMLRHYENACDADGSPLLTYKQKGILSAALERHGFACAIDKNYKEALQAYSAALDLDGRKSLLIKRSWLHLRRGDADKFLIDRMRAEEKWYDPGRFPGFARR